MKDRITLGHEADVAETAALTLADNRATERIFAALDWERERRSAKNRIDAAMRRLKKSDRDFARAVLRGKSWCEMGLAKSTFSDRLKKVENFSRACKQRARLRSGTFEEANFFGRTPRFADCY